MKSGISERGSLSTLVSNASVWILSRRPTNRSILIGALVVNSELLLLLVYLILTSNTVTDGLMLVYPFVWINLTVWAVWSVSRPTATARRTWVVGVFTGLYLIVLSIAGGLIGPGHALHGHAHGGGAIRLTVRSLPPGWSPALLYGGDWVRMSIFPYRLIGYIGLSYLVFVTLLDLDGSAFTGVLGFGTCVSCTWPILSSFAALVFGSGSVVTSAAVKQPYGLSTLVFTTSVLLLVWNPFKK